MDSKSYSILTSYWGIAIGIAVGTASVLLSRNALLRALRRGPTPAVTIIAVLATTLLVFVLYMEGTRQELNFAEEYRILARIGQPEPEHIIIIFLLAMCFGGLIAFSTNLLVFSAILICLQAADLAGITIVRRRFRDAMNKGVPHLTRQAKQSLEYYYNGRSHLLLRSFRLVGSFVALGLAVFASVVRQRPAAIELGWAIVIVSMLSAEGFHYRWRGELKESLAVHGSRGTGKLGKDAV